MLDAIVIQPERPDHPEVRALLEALDEYLASLYEPEANHILDEQALLAPEVSFLVVRKGVQIVGCGAVRRMAGEAATDGQSYGEVKRMYVSPACRGERLGSRLLAALEREMQARGLPLALLETGAEQTEAVRLYERSGYARRGAFGGYPDNGLSLFMAKRLA
jgi:putative acetyltransferase